MYSSHTDAQFSHEATQFPSVCAVVVIHASYMSLSVWKRNSITRTMGPRFTAHHTGCLRSVQCVCACVKCVYVYVESVSICESVCVCVYMQCLCMSMCVKIVCVLSVCVYVEYMCVWYMCRGGFKMTWHEDCSGSMGKLIKTDSRTPIREQLEVML